MRGLDTGESLILFCWKLKRGEGRKFEVGLLNKCVDAYLGA